MVLPARPAYGQGSVQLIEWQVSSHKHRTCTLPLRLDTLDTRRIHCTHIAHTLQLTFYHPSCRTHTQERARVTQQLHSLDADILEVGEGLQAVIAQHGKTPGGSGAACAGTPEASLFCTWFHHLI